MTAEAPHIPIVHDSREWHDLRSRHIGGSEISALWDLPADQRPAYLQSRYALWHIKKGDVPPPNIDNPRTRAGLALEDAIAALAAEQQNWIVTKGGYVRDETTPGMGCTLDYVIAGDPEETGKGALEIKNVDWLVHKRSWVDDEPPLHILLQLQHQLACTGYSWGAVVALVGGNELKPYRYRARPTIIAEIRRRVGEFWASIAEGREPEVDGSDSASAVLRALYAEPADDILEIADYSGEFERWCRAFLDASADRTFAEQRRDEAQNRLLASLGNHAKACSAAWWASLSVGKDTPDRPAAPGEVIRGRRGARRLTVKERT